MIRFPSKHSTGGCLSSAMKKFSEVVEHLELRDLPLQGGLFTWSGGLNFFFFFLINKQGIY